MLLLCTAQNIGRLCDRLVCLATGQELTPSAHALQELAAALAEVAAAQTQLQEQADEAAGLRAKVQSLQEQAKGHDDILGRVRAPAMSGMMGYGTAAGRGCLFLLHGAIHSAAPLCDSNACVLGALRRYCRR